MSIRSILDGHNFSWPAGTGTGTGGRANLAGADDGVPVVVFDGAKTVLVPSGEYNRAVGEGCLRFGGMAPSSDETVVVSGIYGADGDGTHRTDGDGTHRTCGEILAVMAVGNDVWEEAKGRIGGEFRVTSPLLEIAAGRRCDVNIFLTADNLYLAVWEKGLRMAEVLPDNSVDSILYYMQVVGRQFKLRKFDINVGGEQAGLVADALRQYYSGVKICE